MVLQLRFPGTKVGKLSPTTRPLYSTAVKKAQADGFISSVLQNQTCKSPSTAVPFAVHTTYP